jgi:hypothetical protein
MMPGMQDKPTWLARMIRLKTVRFSLLLGNSLEEGGWSKFLLHVSEVAWAY